MKIITRLNGQKQHEVSCVGQFNNQFFSLDALIVKQNECYKAYQNTSSEKDKLLYDELYMITEYMRVHLVSMNNQNALSLKVIDGDALKELQRFSPIEAPVVYRKYKSNNKWSDVAFDSNGDLIVFQ